MEAEDSVIALHDTDKSNDTRNVPMPNMGDSKAERHADGTVGISNKLDTPTGPYVSTKNGRILVYDGTVNRVLIGLAPDGTYGVWVSKEGIDVLSSFS